MKKILLMLLSLACLLCAGVAAAAQPTDAEIMAAFKEGEKVCGWFEKKPLPTDGRIRKDYAYMVYYNVNYPKVRTMSDLRRECDKVFTSTLTNSLIAKTQAYKEFNGGLFVAPVSRGDKKFMGKTEYKIIRDAAQPKRIVIATTTEVLKNAGKANQSVVRYDKRTYNYIETPSGWRFENFSLIY